MNKSAFPVDLELARRLETSDIAGAADYAQRLNQLEKQPTAQVQSIASGLAVVMGSRFPINRAGAMEFGEIAHADLERLEALFAAQGLPAWLSFCPLADPQRLRWLGQQGYQAHGFVHLYLHDLDSLPGPDLPPELHLEAALLAPVWEEASLWAWNLPDTGDNRLFSRLGLTPEAHCLVARWQGQVCAVGRVRITEGLAWLNGGATAPGFRGRGIQQALLQQRLAWAKAEGAEFAAVMAAPGSPSARNIERQGFRLAYSRLLLEKPLARL